MKIKATQKIIAGACALIMTASGTAGVFAGNLPEAGAQDKGGQPQQIETMNDQKPEGQAPEGEMNGQPPQMDAMNGQAPQGQPEMNPGQMPADGEMGQMPADGEMGQMPGDGEFEGQPPVGGKSMEGVLSEINSKLDGTVKATIDSLMSDYRTAVDSERNATDEESKFTAAGLVKELVDALNAALEKAGLSVRIGVPEDKPELPAADSQNIQQVRM